MPMPACEHYPSPNVQLSHAEVSIRSFDQGEIFVPVFELLRHSVNNALTSNVNSTHAPPAGTGSLCEVCERGEPFMSRGIRRDYSRSSR